MADSSVICYQDILDYMRALYYGGARSKEQLNLKEAVRGAYWDVAKSGPWTYYQKEHRIDTVANYSTGTVTFDLTGHAEGERALTISGGTWPSWVKFGRIRFNDVMYIIKDTTTDATVVLLDDVLAPTADITAGVAFELFRSVYPLPVDLWAIEDVMVEDSYWVAYYITPTMWMQRERFYQTLGQAWAWTIMKDPDAHNRWALWVDPTPSAADPLGFIYHRRPSDLRWAGTESAVRTSVFSSSPGTPDLTTNDTLPASAVGSMLRIGDATNYPTGVSGSNPFVEQHIIKAISGGAVTLETDLDASANGANCLVTDVVDMHDMMVEALKAQVEYRAARMFGAKTQEVASKGAIAARELRFAREHESRGPGYGAPPHSRYHYLFSHLAGQITDDV